jgi:hypothetical protein
VQLSILMMKLDVDKKKEIKKQDDTSSYDDRLDVVQSSSKSSFFPVKKTFKAFTLTKVAIKHKPSKINLLASCSSSNG